MSLRVDIPDEIAQAMRVPAAEREQRVRTELALALYAQGVLSFGKARQLALLTKLEFGLLLGQRGVPRHYSAANLEEDWAFACSQ